jgi:hypothetical protein
MIKYMAAMLLPGIGCKPPGAGGCTMIVTTQYILKYDRVKDAYRVQSAEPPYCPNCGFLMSGYDTKRRKAIDATGAVYWLLLRRLCCPVCKTYHIELPACLSPYKQYEAGVIQMAFDKRSSCPADNSTIRRWKK